MPVVLVCCGHIRMMSRERLYILRRQQVRTGSMFMFHPAITIWFVSLSLVTNFGNLIADRIMNLIEVLPISIRLLLLTLMERFMWLSGITLLLQTKISRPVFMLLQVVRMEVCRNGLLRLGLSRVCVHSVLRWLQTDT